MTRSAGLVNSSADRSPAARRARADRILDAAADLLLRWGYTKTSIDDIARHAGVAKGTIYLHWPTREALFRALLQRERLRWTDDVLQRVTADPAGATLHRMFGHAARALAQRPLLKAVVMRQIDLTRLPHSEDDMAAVSERVAAFTRYFDYLRGQQLIRTDISADQQLYMLVAIFMGYFLAKPLVPPALSLTDDVIPELLSETVRTTFDSDRRLTTQQTEAVARMFTEYVERDQSIVASLRQEGIGKT
jgi:AcrR family transcriptional regulator